MATGSLLASLSFPKQARQTWAPNIFVTRKIPPYLRPHHGMWEGSIQWSFHSAEFSLNFMIGFQLVFSWGSKIFCSCWNLREIKPPCSPSTASPGLVLAENLLHLLSWSWEFSKCLVPIVDPSFCSVTSGRADEIQLLGWFWWGKSCLCLYLNEINWIVCFFFVCLKETTIFLIDCILKHHSEQGGKIFGKYVIQMTGMWENRFSVKKLIYLNQPVQPKSGTSLGA